MEAVKLQDQLNITREQLLKIVSLAFDADGEQPNPDEPHKPGPWDPFIREAFDWMKFLGPFPEPWHAGFSRPPEPWRGKFDSGQILRIIARRFPQIWDVIGDGRGFDDVALNPQPLPPRYAFAEALAQVFIRRAEVMSDVIANLRAAGLEERGIIVVGGRDFLTMIDEICGNGFRLIRPKPRPFWWKDSFGTAEYLIMAARFEQSVSETADENLSGVFRKAAAKLLDAGLEKLQ